MGAECRWSLSLFDLSGEWARPWEEAGYQVYRFDIQDDPEVGDVNGFSTSFFIDCFADFEGMDIYAVLAACPCTDFSSSGNQWWGAKDADGRTVSSVNLVHQTLRVIEYFKPAVWAVENPVSRIERLGGQPPWRLAFDPYQLGDPYTKKTLIWGRVNADLFRSRRSFRPRARRCIVGTAAGAKPRRTLAARRQMGSLTDSFWPTMRTIIQGWPWRTSTSAWFVP